MITSLFRGPKRLWYIFESSACLVLSLEACPLHPSCELFPFKFSLFMFKGQNFECHILNYRFWKEHQGRELWPWTILRFVRTLNMIGIQLTVSNSGFVAWQLLVSMIYLIDQSFISYLMLLWLATCSLGILGNAMSMSVLCRKKMKSIFNHLLVGLCTADVTFLVFNVILSTKSLGMLEPIVGDNLHVKTFELNWKFGKHYLFVPRRSCASVTASPTSVLQVASSLQSAFPLRDTRYLQQIK